MATNVAVKKSPGKIGTGVKLAANPITADDEFAAAASSMEFANDGKTLFFVDNQSASTVDVSFGAQKHESLTITDPSTTQEADSLFVYGPFPPELYNDANGKVQVTLSATTTIFVGAISQ